MKLRIVKAIVFLAPSVAIAIVTALDAFAGWGLAARLALYLAIIVPAGLAYFFLDRREGRPRDGA